MKCLLHLLPVLTAITMGASAYAGEAVVPPLVTRGMNAQQRSNLTGLVFSELDFLGRFDHVTQLNTAPSGLNGRCLGSDSCLGGIAQTHSAIAVLAGAASVSGNKLDVFLVLYEDGNIVRTKDFSLTNSPSVIADAMSSMVREVVTGESTAQIQADETVEFDADDEDFDFDADDIVVDPTVERSDDDFLDDFAIEDDLDSFTLDDDLYEEEAGNDQNQWRNDAEARRLSEEEAQRRAQEEARRMAVLEAQRLAEAAEEARRQAEAEARRLAAAAEEARRLAEEEARRLAEDEARRLAENSQDVFGLDDPVEEFDASDEFEFEFASSADSVRDSSQTNTRTTPRSSRTAYVDDYEYNDLDQDRLNSRYSSSRQSARIQRGSSDPVASLTARLGGSKFQALSFVTYGVEIAYNVGRVAIVGGVEGYSAKRLIPEIYLDEGEPNIQWNTIIPINLGALYHFKDQPLQPYLGADTVFIPGYVRDSSSVAVGIRARAGADYTLTSTFAVNLNASVGYWGGKDFAAVQQNLTGSGLVPQVSAGTVLRF